MNIQSPQCIFRGKVTKRTQPPHMDIINQLHQIRARNWTLNEPHMFKIWKFLGHLKTSFNSQNSMKHLRRSRLLIGNNLQFFCEVSRTGTEWGLVKVKPWFWRSILGRFLNSHLMLPECLCPDDLPSYLWQFRRFFSNAPDASSLSKGSTANPWVSLETNLLSWWMFNIYQYLC